jgi:hypothetical protein
MWLHGEAGSRILRWFSKQENTGEHWDDSIRATCPWCGRRFRVSDRLLGLIRAINRAAVLSPDQSPCFELPAEAWDDPRLLSECTICHNTLKFNPFIVDNRGRY